MVETLPVNDSYRVGLNGKSFSPSVLNHDCLAHDIMAFRNIPKLPYSQSNDRALTVGREMEIRLHDQLLNSLVANDLEVTRGSVLTVGNLKGVTDAHADVGSTDEKEIIEIKTMTAADFKKAKKYGMKAAKPSYVRQLNFYLHLARMRVAAGNYDHLNLSHARFMFYNKDNSDIAFETIEYDEDMAMAMLAKAELIMSSNGSYTMISADKSTYPCNFCGYKAKCHEGFNYIPKDYMPTCDQCQHVEFEGKPAIGIKRRCGLTGDPTTHSDCCDDFKIFQPS